MGWKKYDVKPNNLKGQCGLGNKRYVRSIKNPAAHGLCFRDYDSQHAGRAWPADTEYMHAYCSNYTPPEDRLQWQQQQQQQRFDCLEHYMKQDGGQCERQCRLSQHPLHQQHQQPQIIFEKCAFHKQCSEPLAPGQETCIPLTGPKNFSLHDPTPTPLVDKHYRGAHYVPGEPLGVQVPEERSRIRVTSDGPVRITVEEDLSRAYLPLYRYKDWVQRSELEVWHDCNTESAICPLPKAPTQFWDFYNEVRMHRPAKKIDAPQFQTCRVLPIPLDTDIENGAAYDPHGGHFGKFKDYKFETASFQASNLCRC